MQPQQVQHHRSNSLLTNGNGSGQQMVRPGGPPPGPQPQGSFLPPPYRSPPNPQQGKMMAMTPNPPPNSQGAYSKLNISEPNIGGGAFSGSPMTFRHTMNNDNSNQMQQGLRTMLGGPAKHQTLDSAGQSIALQQLRANNPNVLQDKQQRLQNLQSKLPLPGDTYVSPDNLRDAANRIFNRNHHERASFGGNTMMTQNGNQPFYSNQSQILQHQMNSGQRTLKSPPQQQSENDANKRNSFSNLSFRQATGQQKQPPQVPPKPNSRSTSRERLKESLEEVDHLDQELKHILKDGSGQRMSLGGTTPPLPALSPDPTPESSPNHNYISGGKHNSVNRPDLLETSKQDISGSNLRVAGSNRTLAKKSDQQSSLKAGLRKYQEELSAQTAFGALTADLESVLGLQSTDMTSDDSATAELGDAAAIRRQLDGLENMYSEVLKLLGLRKYGRAAPNTTGGFDGKRRKMYGSMSSLPSVSSIGSRHVYKDHRRAPGERGNKRSAGKDGKSYNKRFQRLESHVVTLARTVAHLSSEMRNQHLLLQEVEALRLEVQQLRTGGNGPVQTSNGTQRFGYVDPENFFANQDRPAGANSEPRLNRIQANRVRKLTKFFGDEPPLLRLFLKNLGYEKYASAFEEAKIGLLELPFLSDERLDKLGIPVGPRMRILQEAKITIANEPNYNVYIL